MMMWENYSDEIIEELKFIPFYGDRFFLVVAFNSRLKTWFIRRLSSAKYSGINLTLDENDYEDLREAVIIDDRATMIPIYPEDYGRPEDDTNGPIDLEEVAAAIKEEKRLVYPGELEHETLVHAQRYGAFEE